MLIYILYGCLSVLLVYILVIVIGIFVPLSYSRVQLEDNDPPKRLRIEFYPERPIVECMLIGTHGSAAYRLDLNTLVDDRGDVIKKYGYLIPELTRRWALNHRYSLYDQLMIGVRFVHLEISLHAGEWCTIHSYKAGTLREDLLEIRRFVMLAGSSHFAIVHPHLFVNTVDDIDSDGHTYLTAINMILGTNVREYNPVDPVSTYYNTVAIVASPAESPRDSTANVDMFLRNRDKVIPSGRFFSWVMTPDTNTIIRSILLPFTSPMSLATLYPTKHDNLVAYIQTNQPLRCQCIIIDHVDPAFVTIIDECNQLVQ